MIPAPNANYQAAAQDMLEGMVRAICERPGDTDSQRDARSRDVARSVLGFQPRDTVEIMLAGMVVTHVHLIQDSARDALQGQEDGLKARTKTTIAALDRMMIGFLKEYRLAQMRPIEGWACAEQPSAATRPEVPRPKTSSTPRAPEAQVPEAQVPEAHVPEAHVPEAHVSVSKAPVPLLPPLRRTEASIPAMMAVLSPAPLPGATASPRASGSLTGATMT